VDLSVIVVSFNTKKLLSDCLFSVYSKTKGIDFEVIVVDNDSRDDSPQMVEANFPGVVLIKNGQNLGFAAANNQGLKMAKGRYLLLLNSDTKLIENTLFKMVQWMDGHKKIGVSSCQLLNQDETIQATGGFFPTLPRVLAWMMFWDDLPFVDRVVKPIHPHEPKFYFRHSWYKKEHFQDWVTGAFFLIRREVVKKVGLLDEKFFMYVEEMEYCYRIQKAGFWVFYSPISKIIHLKGRSGLTRNAVLGEFSGLKYFFEKHKPGWQKPFLRLLLKTGAALRIFIFGIIKGNSEARKIYVEAFKIA